MIENSHNEVDAINFNFNVNTVFCYKDHGFQNRTKPGGWTVKT